MAKQQIVQSECDRCHKEDKSPLKSGIKNGRYVLPKGWLHVEGFTDSRSVFEVDLCPDCKGDVLSAAGKAESKLKVVG
jgi:hypothetical protein